MFLTCQQCEVQYRLDPSMLGVGGRMVRCTACGNIWFQPPEQKEEPRKPKTQPPAGDDLLQQIGIGAEQPPAQKPSVEKPPEIVFADVLQQQQSIPDVVKPASRPFQIPVMEYRPMGMGANQFGIFAFLFFTFATMIFLFAVRVPMVNTFPVMSSLYKAIGFTVRAPGEGLRLSEMTAENRVDEGKKRLAVEAKLTNISEKDMEYPALLVSLKGPYGRVLQDWDFKTKDKKILRSGDTVPLKLEFRDADPAGKTVEIKVVEND